MPTSFNPKPQLKNDVRKPAYLVLFIYKKVNSNA